MSTLDTARRFAFRLLGCSLVATFALTGNARAADHTETTVILQEQSDGSLIVLHPTAKQLRAVPLRHQDDAVASHCITLERRGSLTHQRTSVLRNRCAHTVAVSYCIEEVSGSTRACEGLGKRDLQTAQVAAGEALTLAHQAAADKQVNWVACRVDADAVSSLTERGSRGECLTPVIEPLVADIDK